MAIIVAPAQSSVWEIILGASYGSGMKKVTLGFVLLRPFSTGVRRLD